MTPDSTTTPADVRAFRDAALLLFHADRPGNLWDSTSVFEKAIMLKAWNAGRAARERITSSEADAVLAQAERLRAEAMAMGSFPDEAQGARVECAQDGLRELVRSLATPGCARARTPPAAAEPPDFSKMKPGDRVSFHGAISAAAEPAEPWIDRETGEQRVTPRPPAHKRLHQQQPSPTIPTRTAWEALTGEALDVPPDELLSALRIAREVNERALAAEPAEPLSYEQIEDIWAACSDPDQPEMSIHTFARAVIAALSTQPARNGGETGEVTPAMLWRWIPVEERLPTHRHSVLGVVLDGPFVVADDPEDRLIDIVSFGGHSDPRWLQFTGGEEDVQVRVSHWMPRPDLPGSREERKHEAAVALAGEMARSFEVHTGVSWTEPAWREETALWAAAWRLATAHPPAEQAAWEASEPQAQAHCEWDRCRTHGCDGQCQASAHPAATEKAHENHHLPPTHERASAVDRARDQRLPAQAQESVSVTQPASAQVAEPVAPLFGTVVKDTRGVFWFYPPGQPPYLDTAAEVTDVYAAPVKDSLTTAAELDREGGKP